jgi:hypothetical protein
MNGHSANNIFTDAELELHRQTVTLIGGLPEVPWTRCHELARAVAIFFRRSPLKLNVVDGRFGIADHSWIEIHNPNRHIILDVYAVGSIPIVQLHDVGTLSLRGARAFVEGPPRDDIDDVSLEALLHHMNSVQKCLTHSPL